MSSAQSNAARALDQVRDECARLAATAERRNRPSHLLVLAGLLVAVAIISLLFALSAKAEADRRFRARAGNAQEIVDLLARLKQLEQASRAGEHGNFGTPRPTLLTDLQEAGVAAGLSQRPPNPSESSSAPNAQGFRRKQVNFENVIDPSLPALMAWMQNAVKTVPGVEVMEYTLRPGTEKWTLSVKFVRWERQ
jgi:hypothetical protein